jgi:glycogen operon protein
VNYWGDSTVNYFSPAPRYISHAGDLHEFKVLVRRLHEANIEVILDVVYNHTAEGNHLGPTLSFRGIDNASYYMLAQDRRYYFDTTGCGNTVNLRHPRVLQMVMDSLRYWVEECHVDGFRFDLTTSLGREYDHFDPNSVFFDAVAQDPVLSRVKLIAEPWDVGPNGYQVGNFPPGWAEWNGRYRDDIRSFWKGDGALLPAFASRVLGSADLFERRGRKTWASLNFITAHDGFTLSDLYSYNSKHNEANGEDNRDGHDDNRSWNCGVEGPTKDAAILDLRDRMRRNALATLLLSQGTPMLLMGDEVGRTQDGNNNAYCQDNEIAWLAWNDVDERDRAFLEFSRGLIRLRARSRLLHFDRFLHGEVIDGRGIRNVVWYRADGQEMHAAAWTDPAARVVGLLLSDPKARFLLLTNSHHEPIPFKLPAVPIAGNWAVRVDTVTGEIDPLHREVGPDQTYRMDGRSLVLLSGMTA